MLILSGIIIVVAGFMLRFNPLLALHGKSARHDNLRWASALGRDHPVAAMAGDVAERHLSASLPHVTGDYMGEHWLASFALLALEG